MKEGKRAKKITATAIKKASRINFTVITKDMFWRVIVFPLSRFFSANRQFDGARVNQFWLYSEHSFRKFDKFVET